MKRQAPGPNFRKPYRWVKSALLGAVALYAGQYFGPFVLWNDMTALEGVAVLFIADAAFSLASDILWWLGNQLEKKAAETPTGKKGEAAFVEDLSELKIDREKSGIDVYCGAVLGDPAIVRLESNMTVMSPNGGGKTTGIIIPNIWFIKASKIVLDFKGELSAIMAKPLRQRGERVIIFDLGADDDDDGQETLASYNLLCLICDCYTRRSGLKDVTDDVFAFVKQLLPDPSTGGDVNDYFRDGSRDLIRFCIQACILIHGTNATLGHVASMLNDRDALMNHALWASGKLKATFDTSMATHDFGRTMH